MSGPGRTPWMNMAVLCREFGVNKFVLASTSSLYGQDNPMPWQEDQDSNHPLSPYTASKKAAETLSYTYHYLYNIDVTIFRYFTVYGPAGRPDMSRSPAAAAVTCERNLLRPVRRIASSTSDMVSSFLEGIYAGQLIFCPRSFCEIIAPLSRE